MPTLTPKQQAVYGQLVEYIREYGRSPTVRELCEVGGFRSTRTVVQYLNALEASGVIVREKTGARNIRLVFEERLAEGTISVPVVGRVAAGQPILAQQNIVDEIPVSRSLARGSRPYYFLEVRGDSMDQAGIMDGDLVLVRQQDTASHNETVVALIDEEATVKRLRLGRSAVILQPMSSNPTHRPIVLDHDFRIQGVVIASFNRSDLYPNER